MRSNVSYSILLVSLVGFLSFASGCSESLTATSPIPEGSLAPSGERTSLVTSVPLAATVASAASSANSWTFCTAAGAPCDFTGLRDVRLGGRNGPYVQQTAFGSVPCATYGFDDRNPAPNQALHCDIGPVKMQTIDNPMPAMGGFGSTVTVPLGPPGSSAQRTRPTSDRPSYADGSGAFRTTCYLATYAFNDPIVYPGRPGASHLHVFFGNAGVNASSSPASLVASGNSTCLGGTLNRSAYWMPALTDVRTGTVQVPDVGIFYYKTGYNMAPATIQTPPAGLQMIAGNKNSTVRQEYAFWGCRDKYVNPTGSVPTRCPVGDAVRLTIQFPQCWDGVNLDSPDHKSHMAYPNYRNPPQRSSCPASHPVPLPEITEHFDFRVSTSSAPSSWRLSSDMYSTSIPGGYSAHADWMNGWDEQTMSMIVKQCLNKALDCQVGMLGNGRELY